jgi:hypothetical protein
MLQRLDRLGRCKIDIINCGIDWNEVIKNCIAPFYEQAIHDPDKFISELMLLTDADSGGFATYGASSLMFELVPDSAKTGVGLALLDRAIEFKIRRGLPPVAMTGHEMQRYAEIKRYQRPSTTAEDSHADGPVEGARTRRSDGTLDKE